MSIMLLVLAPVLLGTFIFGTTMLLPPGKKPNANTNLGKITITAQLITTILIPDKVATTVSYVLTIPSAVVTKLPIIPSVITTDVVPPATITNILSQRPIKEVLPPPLPSSKPKPEATTAKKAVVVTTTVKPVPSTTVTTESPTPIKVDITIFPDITVPNPFDLTKPVKPPKPTTTTTTTTTTSSVTAAVVAPTSTTVAKEDPQ
ncbi:hypothetical protein BG015_005357 [Linnemannia schmuckeri]|uniref:Uncharacterized protein n=1 Tax=Linnemannia schmuckeri TaxID=64567 RepID=A0A9P5S4E6_9FUNG|nr:hypothetical protein BG015_005357 [Linnemannia schmuckeri]